MARWSKGTGSRLQRCTIPRPSCFSPRSPSMDRARQYRRVARLDKDGAAREGTGGMTMAASHDDAKAPPSHVGVLLVNLGTPDTADAKACAPTSGNFSPTRA